MGQQRNANAQEAVGARLLPYFRVANVFDGYLDTTDVLTMPFGERAQDRLALQQGDILLCEGQSRELVGRAAMYAGELPEAAFQNTLIRFRAGPQVLPEYALLVFRAYQASGVFSAIAKATTNLAHLGAKRFSDLPFPLPPIDTQARLSAVAKASERQVAGSIEAFRSMTSTVGELLPAVRDQVVLRSSAATRAFERWTTLAEVVSDPIVYGVLKPGPDSDGGYGVPIVSGTDLRNGYIATSQLKHTTREIADDHARSLLRSGDVLMSIIRNTRVAVVPPELEGAQITRTNARIRPDSSLLPRFLYHWLASSASQRWLQQRMRGIDMPGLNLKDVRLLPVPRISLDQQRAAVEVLDRVETESTTVNDVALKGLLDAEQLRRKLLVRTAYGDLSFLIKDSEEDADYMTQLMSSILPSPQPKLLPDTQANRSSLPKAGDLPQRDYQRATDSTIRSALVSNGGRCSTEELFSLLSLGQADVDDFYLALRGLVSSGDVTVARSGDSQVEIVAS